MSQIEGAERVQSCQLEYGGPGLGPHMYRLSSGNEKARYVGVSKHTMQKEKTTQRIQAYHPEIWTESWW